MSEPTPSHLDLRSFHDAKGIEIVSALAVLAKSHSHSAICQSLLAEIRRENLLPWIFSVFLSWSKSPHVISQCLQQEDTSMYIRWLGIRHFGKALANHRRWRSAWESVGGTQGVIDLLSRFSVTHVKALTLAIGCCNRGRKRIKEREVIVEELLKALLPSHYPKSTIINSDKRPLQDHYARMVTACSPDFVAGLLDARDSSNPLFRELPKGRLIKSHWEILRSRVDTGLHGQESQAQDVRNFFKPLLFAVPPLPGSEPRTSASMDFSLKVLQQWIKDPDRKPWPGMVEAEIVWSLMRRSIKKKRKEDQIHSIIALSLEVLEVRPDTKRTFEQHGMWTIIAKRWGEMPDLYEDVLIRALQLRLSGGKKTLGKQYLQTQANASIRPKLRWNLLRLYCLHVPDKPADINTADELRSLKGLMWPVALFSGLEREKAIQFLKGLLRIEPNSDWLELEGRRSSILRLSSVGEQKNMNAILLLTCLQNGSEEAVERAKEAVTDFKNKSAGAREQPQRALYAKAASFFAIASGSLELYADVVEWQQRYIRDPLTIKVIFANDAINTTEGLQLLSGIPDPTEDASKCVDWVDIKIRIKKANGILMTFQEMQRLARKEPSYHKGDWAAMWSLFGQAVTTRANRAKSLQAKLRASDAHVYGSVWYETLQMLGKVDGNALGEAINSVKDLIKGLSPALLATTTRDLLELDNEKRATKNREDQDHSIEQLTYDALQQLAGSDKPHLASDLILNTILERPDASSWHRYLLSIGFLKRLPAKSAEHILLNFATAIGEKLEEQSYVKVGQNAQAPSVVKVTTVKYLAQILDNAEFISADATVDVLTELFKSGTHRDIRIATLESMLSMLNKLCSGTEASWSENPLIERLLAAMESVVSIVGSINESRPPRDEDWQEAKETRKLPEIYDHAADKVPPLLQVIMGATVNPQYPALVKFRARFVKRILIPALNLSEVEHRRWLSMFVTKYKAPITADNLQDLSLIPARISATIISFHELVPSHLLERYHKFICLNIAKSATLKQFNARLAKYESQQQKAEIKHWLALFDQDVASSVRTGTMMLIARIHSKWKPSEIADGISLDQIQTMILDQASLVLDNYDENISVWNNLVTRLRPSSPRTASRTEIEGWAQTCKLVLQRLINLVSSKRTTKWQRDPSRHPSILPSTNKLRLWLLAFPSSNRSSDEWSRQCIAYADEVRKLVVVLTLESPLQANIIAQDALTISSPLTDEERVRVALVLAEAKSPADLSRAFNRGSAFPSGQLEQVLTLSLADIAVSLIADSHDWLDRNKESRKRFGRIIQRWQKDPVEELRERAVNWRRDNERLWNKFLED